MAFNNQVIEEFRANGGNVGGFFAGKPLLLLHHTGAKTGTARVTPLVYAQDGDRYIVAASKGGSPSHPHWYLNLQANPDVTIDLGDEKIPAKAMTVPEGPERDALYAKFEAILDNFTEYKKIAGRVIPVVSLERAG